MTRYLDVIALATCVVGSVITAYLCVTFDRRYVDLDVLPGRFQEVGPVRQGTTTTVNYVIRNRTSVPLQILDVSMSCACTGFNLSREHLAPGEATVLTLNFDSGQRRGFVPIRGVIAYGKEQSTHILHIGLNATIDPDYGVEPDLRRHL